MIYRGDIFANMNWQELINTILNDLRMSTYDVQDRTGIPHPVLHKLRTGITKKPNQNTVKKLEEGLGIKINDTDPENISYQKITTEEIQGFVMEGALPVQEIPVLANVYAGDPAYLDHEVHEETMPALNLKPGHRYYGLVVNGRSMETTLRDGDKIVIDMDSPVVDGCLVAIKLKNGHQYVKRYYNLNYAFIQLTSDNKDEFGTRLIDKNDIEACHRVVSVNFAL